MPPSMLSGPSDAHTSPRAPKHSALEPARLCVVEPPKQHQVLGHDPVVLCQLPAIFGLFQQVVRLFQHFEGSLVLLTRISTVAHSTSDSARRILSSPVVSATSAA